MQRRDRVRRVCIRNDRAQPKNALLGCALVAHDRAAARAEHNASALRRRGEAREIAERRERNVEILRIRNVLDCDVYALIGAR